MSVPLGWLGTTTGLDVLEKRIFRRCRELAYDSFVVQTVA
jgi:hypothetical protein